MGEVNGGHLSLKFPYLSQSADAKDMLMFNTEICTLLKLLLGPSPRGEVIMFLYRFKHNKRWQGATTCACAVGFDVHTWVQPQTDQSFSTVMSSNCLFCPTNSPKSIDSSVTVRTNTEKQQILTFNDLEPAIV